MSTDPEIAPEGDLRRKPVMRRFRSAASIPRLAPAVAARHSRAATAAFLTLRNSATATAFLNAHHDRLGGRPLDVAGESEAGLEAVEQAIRDHAAG